MILMLRCVAAVCKGPGSLGCVVMGCVDWADWLEGTGHLLKFGVPMMSLGGMECPECHSALRAVPACTQWTHHNRQLVSTVEMWRAATEYEDRWQHSPKELCSSVLQCLMHQLKFPMHQL